jgi:hypothetical protein
MNYGEGLTSEYHMRNYGGHINTPIGDHQTMNDNLRMDMARLEAKMDVIISMLQNRGGNNSDAPINHEF